MIEKVLNFDNVEEPLVDLGVVEDVLDRLKEMSIELDFDPLGGGPTRLQAKIAVVRNYLTQVQRWFEIFSQADYTLTRALNSLRSEYELKLMDLLANDPEVKGPASQRDREAVANFKLMRLLQKKFRLEEGVHDTKAVLRALTTKRIDLKDVIARLRDQMRLCQDELALDRKWGSKVPNAKPLISDPRMRQAIADDIDMLLHDVIGKEADSQILVTEKAILVEKTKAEEKDDDNLGSALADSQASRDEVDEVLGDLDLGVLDESEEGLFDPDNVDSLPDDFWEN